MKNLIGQYGRVIVALLIGAILVAVLFTIGVPAMKDTLGNDGQNIKIDIPDETVPESKITFKIDAFRLDADNPDGVTGYRNYDYIKSQVQISEDNGDTYKTINEYAEKDTVNIKAFLILDDGAEEEISNSLIPGRRGLFEIRYKISVNPKRSYTCFTKVIID